MNNDVDNIGHNHDVDYDDDDHDDITDIDR